MLTSDDESYEGYFRKRGRNLRIITDNGADIPYEPMVFDIEICNRLDAKTGEFYDRYQVVARSAYCDIGTFVVSEHDTEEEAIRGIARVAYVAMAKVANGERLIPCTNDVASDEIKRMNSM